MEVIKSVFNLRKIINKEKKADKIIGFVPTMGYLHKGHVALIKEAKNNCDYVIVSIYVNPTQFGVNEDLESYPKDLDKDLAICEEENVDIVFTPPDEEVYSEGFQTFVDVGETSKILCGAKREGHFRGVATIVAKLFNIVQPDKAYFGLKDYQQLKVIERMTQDLNFNIDIIGVPTVRDKDGIATSSRNSYLSEDERAQAKCIYQSLCEVKNLISKGVKDTKELKQAVNIILDNKDKLRIDYLEFINPQTFEDIEEIEDEILVAIAAYVGKARLIDNILISEVEK